MHRRAAHHQPSHQQTHQHERQPSEPSSQGGDPPPESANRRGPTKQRLEGAQECEGSQGLKIDYHRSEAREAASKRAVTLMNDQWIDWHCKQVWNGDRNSLTVGRPVTYNSAPRCCVAQSKAVNVGRPAIRAQHSPGKYIPWGMTPGPVKRVGRGTGQTKRHTCA